MTARRVALWMLAGILVIGAVALVASRPLTTVPFWAIDFHTYRAAAAAMAAGVDPYVESNIVLYSDGAAVGNIHDYLYPPYFAVLFRPFTWLSPAFGSRVWFALNLALIFAGVGILLVMFNWAPSPLAFLGLLLGAALFPPLRTALNIGQSTVLIFSVVSASLLFWQRGRHFASGMVMSLGLFKPHLLPLVLFFFVCRQWRWLSGLGTGLLVLHLPFVGWLGEWSAAATSVRASNLSLGQCFQMTSVTSLLPCLVRCPPWLPAGIALSTFLALLIALWRGGYLTAHPDPAEMRRAFWALGVTTAVGTLLIDHTRVADQLILIFPLLLIWRTWGSFRGRAARNVAIGLMSVLYLVPYCLDLLGPLNVAYMLPFWYVVLPMAMLAVLWLQRRCFDEPTA